MAEEKRVTTLFLSLGRQCSWKGEEYRTYVPITEEMLKTGEIAADYIEERSFNFSGKALKNAVRYMGGSAGIVYAVEQPADNPNSLFTGTAAYRGTWPDQEQRATWQMADQTAGQQIALAKQAKRAKSDDAVLECLAPIREAYSQARGMQRSLILARAVQYITRG